jgi:hypothetical protein
MTQPGLIDRRGRLNWADSIGARSELPRLIRRLILETGKGVVEFGFPAGEGVSAASWDGTVRSSEDAPYVPAGLSLWELSVEKSPGGKADGDYAKRTSTPDASGQRSHGSASCAVDAGPAPNGAGVEPRRGRRVRRLARAL